MNLSKLQELVKDREAWHAAVHGVAESDTTELNWTDIEGDIFDIDGIKQYVIFWVVFFFPSTQPNSLNINLNYYTDYPYYCWIVFHRTSIPQFV